MIEQLGAAWRAERVKLRATRQLARWAALVFAAAVAVSALMGWLIVGLSPDDLGAPTDAQDQARSIYASPLVLSYLMAFAAGVGLYARERHHATLAMSFLVAPRREAVVLAKMGAGVLVGAACGLAYVAGVLAGGGAVLASRGMQVVPTGGVLRTLAVMSLLLVLWVVMGTGLGMCLPSMPALLSGVAVALVLPPLLSPLLGSVPTGRTLAGFLPGLATQAATEPQQSLASASTGLPWWGSLAVVLGWSVALICLGARRVSHSDVEVD